MSMAVAGTLCWWSILLAPWRAWSVREQLEPSTDAEVKQLFNNVTVLIPARNEAQFIDHTLSKLQAQGEGLRIIVIDDQSEDQTAVLANRQGVEIISGTTPPQTGAESYGRWIRVYNRCAHATLYCWMQISTCRRVF